MSNDPKREVNLLLKQCRVLRPPVPVEKIARSLGIEIRYAPLEEDISGLLFKDGKDVIIGVNSLHHPNRQRFTIAHEIGHFVLHRMEIHVDNRTLLRDRSSSKAVDLKEIEANQFAAMLLMPDKMLVRDSVEYLEEETIVERLATRYKVSAQAMAFRLGNLGFMRTL